MAIKNYTTTVSAARSLQEVTDALVRCGAVGILSEYDEQRRVKTLAFRLMVAGNVVSFALPIDWRRFKEVLRRQRKPVWMNDDRVYNIAARCVRDWVLAQVALHETNLVELPQVFLPYATNASGQTLYARIVAEPRLLLGAHPSAEERQD